MLTYQINLTISSHHWLTNETLMSFCFQRLDQRLEELGGKRMVEVGLGDDQHSELYRSELYKWLETLLPILFGKEGGGPSFLDPPEPLFKLAYAPGTHRSSFRPLPPKYHFVKLEAAETQVARGYDRPASMFTFDLEETGVQYDVGDHLAVLPRNPEYVVDQVLDLYSPSIRSSDLLTVEPVDCHSDCPFPPVLTAKELLTQVCTGNLTKFNNHWFWLPPKVRLTLTRTIYFAFSSIWTFADALRGAFLSSSFFLLPR